MDNILVVGSGFFSQNIYIPFLVKKKFKLFIYDERPELLKKTAHYFKIDYLENITKSTINKNSIRSVFICYERFKSFKLCKFFLQNKVNVFAEKPVCQSSAELAKLQFLAKKNNLVFLSSFQRVFYKSSNEFKKKFLNILKNNKQKLNLYSLFYSGNFRYKARTLVRTNEIIKLKKKKNQKLITRMVFLNRYWHIINFIFFILNINNKNIKYLKTENLIKKSLTKYIVKLKYKNINISLFLIDKNYKKNIWSEKYILKKKNKKLLNLKLPAPMNFIDGNLNGNFDIKSDNVFNKQINFFFKKIKNKNLKNIEINNCLKQLIFIEKNIINAI